MNETITRVIDTGIRVTPECQDCLKAIIGQMGDGMWENSTHVESFWRCARIVPGDTTMLIKVESEPYYCCRNYYRKNPYYGMKDWEIIRYFAGKLRRIINAELKYIQKVDNTFNRDYISADLRLDWLSYSNNVTVGLAHTIQRAMVSRVNDMKKLEVAHAGRSM